MLIDYISPTATAATVRWNYATSFLQNQMGKWPWQERVLFCSPFQSDLAWVPWKQRHVGQVKTVLHTVALKRHVQLQQKGASVCNKSCRWVCHFFLSLSLFGSNMLPENRGTWSSFFPGQWQPGDKCFCHQVELTQVLLCPGDTLELNWGDLQKKQCAFLLQLLLSSCLLNCTGQCHHECSSSSVIVVTPQEVLVASP